jgi:cytochrome P450
LTLHDGVVIPAGADIWIPIWVIQRSERNFERPLEFLPERFLNAPDSSHPYTWIPFSAGMRTCAGMKFALLEATLVLAAFVRKFSVEVDPSFTIKPKYTGLVQGPENGLKATIRRRVR